MRLARSARSDAAAQLRHLHAPPRQSWKHVFQLRQFHLQLTFPRARVPRKDVENQLRAIDDARVNHSFDVALLRWREIVIEQNHIGGDRGRRARNLFQLAFADQRRRIGTILALRKLARNLCPRARGQGPHLVERIFGSEIGGGEIRLQIRRIRRQ